jgi:hypothetical protein
MTVRCWVSVSRLKINVGRRERGQRLEPPIVLEHRGKETYAHSAVLLGKTRIVYDPDGLNNGVRVWVEAEAAEVDDPLQNVS